MYLYVYIYIGAATVLEAMYTSLADTIHADIIQQALLTQATTNVSVDNRVDLDNYLMNGYVRLEEHVKAATLTLTYAFDDYVLGKFCELVGDSINMHDSLKRAKNYKYLWSPVHQYMCPRNANNELVCPLNSIGPDSWKYFTEGDTNHWSLFVQHDPEGLIDLYPSNQQFYTMLDTLLVNQVPAMDKVGETLPNPYYWQGNEIGFFGIFYFSYKGNHNTDNDVVPPCTKTQYWSRELTNMHFNTAYNGIPGNDDYGTESAWLLFNTLGFYPQAGTTRFIISSPRVKSATLYLNTNNNEQIGTKVIVLAYNNSKENVYINRLYINGVEHNSPFIDRSVLVQQECKLEFYMTNTPISGLCK